jgi:HD-GYP domain-containing protein (c-di-GMP phosphodiesterase class II)
MPPDIDNQPRDHQHDPLEAIYALNIGDFVAENFISDDLLDRISNRLASDPNRLRRQLEELVDIYAIEKTLSVLGFNASEDYVIYDSIASTLAGMFGVDACHIFQPAKKEVSGYYLSLTGTSLHLPEGQRWNVGLPVRDDDLLGQCFLDKAPVVVTNLNSEANALWHPIEQLNQAETQAALLMPMMGVQAKSGVQGVLCLESKQPRAFGEPWVTLAKATAKVFVCSVQLQQWIDEARQLLANPDASLDKMQALRAQITDCIADLGMFQHEFVEALGRAIDARQDYTEGHSQRVANLSRDLAEAFQLNEKTQDLVYYAGLLGNLGRLNLPNQLLEKQHSLSASEWDAYYSHANAGVALLSQMHILSDIVPYVTFQHERWNGHGSPQGLAGKAIPFGSRLLAVANAYEALVHERPYRDRAYSHDEAVRILMEESGSKWDPDVVAKLSKLSLITE